MDFNLSDDIKEINDAIKRFVDKEVLPLEEKHKEEIGEGRFNKKVRELGAGIRKKSVELGYYTLHMPEKAGGGGGGPRGTDRSRAAPRPPPLRQEGGGREKRRKGQP